MTLYPKTLQVTTGRTLSNDSSHECIVLHQSLPASHVLIPISGGIMPSEEPPQESTWSHRGNPSEVGGSPRPQMSILVGFETRVFFIFSCGFDISMFCLISNPAFFVQIDWDESLQPENSLGSIETQYRQHLESKSQTHWGNTVNKWTFLRFFFFFQRFGDKQQKYTRILRIPQSCCRSWHSEFFQEAHWRSWCCMGGGWESNSGRSRLDGWWCWVGLSWGCFLWVI